MATGDAHAARAVAAAYVEGYGANTGSPERGYAVEAIPKA
jgi:hypothetical protein